MCPSSVDFDTVELVKRAMAVIKEAGVPPALHSVALRIAAEDLRKRTLSPESRPQALAAPKSNRKATNGSSHTGGVLQALPPEDEFFATIAEETGVSTTTLADVFHVDEGRLLLKVPSKALGSNKRAQTQTITALLGGAVFGGTDARKLAFAEISGVCSQKRCFDTNNCASSIRATPGFGVLGSGRSSALTTKSGWQAEFAGAVARVLGTPEPKA